jgi:hypothetical protein
VTAEATAGAAAVGRSLSRQARRSQQHQRQPACGMRPQRQESLQAPSRSPLARAPCAMPRPPSVCTCSLHLQLGAVDSRQRAAAAGGGGTSTLPRCRQPRPSASSCCARSRRASTLTQHARPLQRCSRQGGRISTQPPAAECSQLQPDGWRLRRAAVQQAAAPLCLSPRRPRCCCLCMPCCAAAGCCALSIGLGLLLAAGRKV